MTVYQTAYHTTACQGFVISKIQDGLEKAAISNFIQPEASYAGAMVVRPNNVIDELVPGFVHPMGFTHQGKPQIAVDVRTTTRYDQFQNGFVVRNQPEYDAIVLRGALNKIWLTDTAVMKSASSLPLNVYANWLGEAVSKRLALEPMDQLKVSILAAIFYLSLFSDNTVVGGSEKTTFVSIISRTLNYKADVVFDAVEAFPTISSVEDFCKACQEHTQSVRMRDLNAGTLFAMVGGFWYGANARELMAVALEHPPTWMVLIFQAIQDRGFRNAQLAKLLERGSYKKHSENYLLQVLNLVKSRTQ